MITDSFHFHHYSVTSSSAPLFGIIVCGGSKRLKRIQITWERYQIWDESWENRNTNPNNELHISLVCQKDFNLFYIFSKISLLHIILYLYHNFLTQWHTHLNLSSLSSPPTHFAAVPSLFSEVVKQKGVTVAGPMRRKRNSLLWTLRNSLMWKSKLPFFSLPTSTNPLWHE